jgi:hypothetical protein
MLTQDQKDSIRLECIRRFPPGSIVKNTHGALVMLEKDQWLYTIHYNDLLGDMIYASSGAGLLYYKQRSQPGVWAELIELPKGKPIEPEKKVFKFN